MSLGTDRALLFAGAVEVGSVRKRGPPYTKRAVGPPKTRTGNRAATRSGKALLTDGHNPHHEKGGRALRDEPALLSATGEEEHPALALALANSAVALPGGR